MFREEFLKSGTKSSQLWPVVTLKKRLWMLKCSGKKYKLWSLLIINTIVNVRFCTKTTSLVQCLIFSCSSFKKPTASLKMNSSKSNSPGDWLAFKKYHQRLMHISYTYKKHPPSDLCHASFSSSSPTYLYPSSVGSAAVIFFKEVHSSNYCMSTAKNHDVCRRNWQDGRRDPSGLGHTVMWLSS